MTKPVRHFSWKQAEADQDEREQKQAKKVKGDIEFTVMTGWHRLCALSVETYCYKWFPVWAKWLLYALAFLALVRLVYYVRY